MRFGCFWTLSFCGRGCVGPRPPVNSFLVFFWAILVPPHLLAMYFLNPPVFHIALHFRGVNEFPCAIPGFRVEFRVSGPLGTPLEPPDTRHETLNTRQPPKKPFASGPTHTKMKKWFFLVPCRFAFVSLHPTFRSLEQPNTSTILNHRKPTHQNLSSK